LIADFELARIFEVSDLQLAIANQAIRRAGYAPTKKPGYARLRLLTKSKAPAISSGLLYNWAC
jgi:hypothetical protein